MKMMLILLVAAAALCLIYFLFANKWRALVSGSGNEAEEVRRKYNYLLERGVKCRLKVEAVQGMAAGFQAAPGDGPETTKLMVHKNETDKALVLLEQYEKEKHFNPEIL